VELRTGTVVELYELYVIGLEKKLCFFGWSGPVFPSQYQYQISYWI